MSVFSLHGGGAVDENTSAYCQARSRLVIEPLQRLRQAVANHGEKLLPTAQQLWYGLRPKVIDGTTLILPDTQQNQGAYPQSRSQKPGCGFPLLKLVGIFSLSSGMLLDYAKGNKHKHELNLLSRLLEHFKPGDLVLGDRGFCGYALIALLWRRGVPGVFRLHQRRSADLRRGRRLGAQDRLQIWTKPLAKPRYLPSRLWREVPSQLEVRVLRVRLNVPGYRSRSLLLATTLTDAKVYRSEELGLLYLRRWRIELWFRDIKTSMGMEALRCQSPAMVHKELEMFLIAYNLIRALGVEAAVRYEVPGDRISFKGTVDAAREYSVAISQARSEKKRKELVADLLRVLAADQVPERPGRREPRAVKRRPKPYPLLNKTRRKFKEIPHRSNYRKPKK